MAKILSLIIVLGVLGACRPDAPADLVPLSARFDRITQSYAFPIPNLDPVPGLIGLKASDCGVCHQAIYREWRMSTHATALQDIQFQAELAKPDSPKWICLNCHIPLQNQRDSIVTSLVNGDLFRPVKRVNPAFNPELQKEGISCATCHVRPDSAGRSTIVGPNGSTRAPHPVRQDPAFLRNMCQRCHNPQGEGLTRNLICWFETTRELAEAQPQLEFSFGEPRDCVSCHMPPVRRRLAEAYTQLPVREVNQHHWTGSGIPKWYPAYDSLLARGYVSGLDVEISGLDLRQDSLHVTVRLTNARAGHYLPTADPERFLLTLAVLQAPDGRRLHQESLRIGQTWRWNPARKVGDNRLKQGEARVWQVALPVPENRQGVRLAVFTYNVRLSSENARHMMATEGVDERFLENGQRLVREIAAYYPFAMLVFREEIELTTWHRRRYSMAELIELSRAERHKPLAARDY